MKRISCLLGVGWLVGLWLASMAGLAVAEANCPQGATCKCVPTTFTKCKVDAQGRQYDCQTSKGETCTVVSGPGSGTATVVQPGEGPGARPYPGAHALPEEAPVLQADPGGPAPPGRGKAAGPKAGAPGPTR